MKKPFDCISDFIFIDDPLEKVDVIFVHDGSNPQLMEKAAELYHQGFASYILPSGGFKLRQNETESERENIYSLISQFNFPEQAILKENKTLEIYENAEFSRKVLLDSNIQINKAIIVCKTFHARRVLLTYQAAFPLSTTFLISSVTENRGITKDNWFKKSEHISIVMGEVIKIGAYVEDFVPKWV